jgi:hypothetical protein
MQSGERFFIPVQIAPSTDKKIWIPEVVDVDVVDLYIELTKVVPFVYLQSNICEIHAVLPGDSGIRKMIPIATHNKMEISATYEHGRILYKGLLRSPNHIDLAITDVEGKPLECIKFATILLVAKKA